MALAAVLALAASPLTVLPAAPAGATAAAPAPWPSVRPLRALPTVTPAPRRPAAPVRSAPGRSAEPGDVRLAAGGREGRSGLTRERFYFAMTDRFANGDARNDRGGLTGDRLATGFDPADKGFYQGGDLEGLIDRLDYVKGLGTTAVWLTPTFQNRPVQGSGADVSAGYHGYWITDFTRIDSHLGTNADMKRLVDEAHKRGMKVFFDIITNHTADGIDYAEQTYDYRSKAAYPYLDGNGRPFDDSDHSGGGTAFPKVTRDSFPYSPVARDGVRKTPSWLNDVTLYHNRGDSTFAGESSEHGDFSRLDDLWTERPEVVSGMTDIYKSWVRDAGVDGFRIDTVKHVDMEFWKRFVPGVEGYAERIGNKDFFMFGEVYSGDPAVTSRYTTEGRLPAVLDFPFQEAARAYVSGGGAADRLQRLYGEDDRYTDADSSAYSLPTFLGNHDMGRIGGFLRRDLPEAGDAELLRRDLLAHELMYLTRGQPVVYYGDEQGFTGKGGDKDARASMFASKTASYLEDDLIGTTATHARDNYATGHPIYRGIASLAGLTTRHPALRDGAQIERLADGGVYAFSRIDGGAGPGRNVEYVVAMNNGAAARQVRIPTFSAGTSFTPIYPAPGGAAPPATPPATQTTAADKTLAVSVPPMSAVVFQAGRALPAPAAGPSVSITLPGEQVSGRPEIRADVPGDGFDQVTFAAKVGDGPWRRIGTDDNRAFRVFHDLTGVRAGTRITYKAIARDSAGRVASARATATVAPEPAEPEPGVTPRDWLLVHYQRTDAAYDGWGLHVWGDVERPTTWEEPLPFAGEDGYGRFAWVKLKPGATNVGFAPHKGEERDGGDRAVNPARSGEIWLTQGKEEVHGSRASAQGHATIRYRRPGGDLDGWGLHLWGDGIADGAGTTWEDPREPDGTDSYGAYWKVPLKNADAAVNFIVHKGDTKDPGPDQAFVPARTPEAFVDSGEATVHASSAAADGVAILHYRRPAGDYDGWGLHVWSGAAEPTEWATPLRPAGTDAYGVYFRVPLAAGATSLSYILHKGDEKDLPTDQSLDLGLLGNEVWAQAATEGYLLPQLGGSAPDADLTKARAQWIDRRTVAWKVEPSASNLYALEYAPDGSLSVSEDGEITGDRHLLRLSRVSGGLTAEQRGKWPHLASYAAFTVDPRDAGRVAEALRGQVIAVERDAGGGLRTATGVQLPGVLDDLYAPAATADLGPVWRHRRPTLTLWAPTARKVALEIGGDGASNSVPMRRDDRTGAWSVTGPASWKGRSYRFAVTVFAPAAGKVVTNAVTDPYGLALTADSARSVLADLSDPATAPAGWSSLRKPRAVRQGQASVYELHVRDFSASDRSVPAARRGTYGAFTASTGAGAGAGMRELRGLAEDGLTHVHLLPAFDFGTVPERRDDRKEPACDLAAQPPDSAEQQKCVAAVQDSDGFNWGYDPVHYTVPEGSYASDPGGTVRTREFRGMVAGLNGAGLRVVMDVVYNHTVAAGQDPKSVLDRIVPGYYQRLLDDGTVATSTCCPGTAPEHTMMGRLVVDSVVTWARQYKVDGFRFDLMGHHPKANMLAVRKALDGLTVDRDGVDGRSILLYGEGWDFGEIAGGARFEQATQAAMAGTGIGTFNDRLRDAVRGGGPFDEDPRVQGLGSGLAGAPNGSPANGSAAEQRARLLKYGDQIKVGLTGNLKDFRFTGSSGKEVTGGQVDYGGSPAGYTAAPGEAVTYVDAHDNETLFDALAYKLPADTPMADRVRMQALSLAAPVLSQGTAFLHAGSERLRSKSLDRNSYDSGDWFNRLQWDCRQGNGFGAGLPPAPDNEPKWVYARPLLANPGLRPSCDDVSAARERTGEWLRIRTSSPVFSLGSAGEVQQRLSFPLSGESEIPGVVTMHLDGRGLDPRWRSVTVVFNATPGPQRQTVAALKGAAVTLHPVQAASADPVVRRSVFDASTGALTVPGRTVAVFVGS